LQLRSNEVRRLVDEEPDSGIVEAALSAHLSYANVAVPVRNRAICGEGLKADASQSVDWWNHDRHGGAVQRNEVDTVERVVSGVVLAWAPGIELRLGGLIQCG